MALFFVFVSAAMASMACFSPSTPTPDESVDPREVLQQAVGRVLALESGAFTLEHEKGTTVLLPGIEMSKVYGVADIPDRFRFTVEAKVSNTFVETGVVVIEDRAYMTNFLTGKWEPVAPEILPLNFSNLGQTLGDVIQAVQEPVLVGTGQLDAYDVYRIQGTVRSEDLSALVPAAVSGFDVVLELWVDRSQWILLQVVMTGKLVDTDAPDTVRVLTLDDIDVPVDIRPPL